MALHIGSQHIMYYGCEPKKTPCKSRRKVLQRSCLSHRYHYLIVLALLQTPFKATWYLLTFMTAEAGRIHWQVVEINRWYVYYYSNSRWYSGLTCASSKPANGHLISLTFCLNNTISLPSFLQYVYIPFFFIYLWKIRPER
jgi:hypothetical protein